MTWKKWTPDELRDFRRGRAAWLKKHLAELPAVDSRNWGESHAARTAAVVALEKRLMALPDNPPVRIGRPGFNGASVSMLGIRSTSTEGLVGALQNWIARVEKMESAHETG